ncbi:MAG: hypothetical protein Q7S04_02965 [Candidatus Moranbacteria bacterium]|nr:hypothetical protein [Candidatus Moranbacteria bacterium]
MIATIDIKSRPLKLAFLVDPKKQREILTAIELSCSLWGGAFNPIIPFYTSVPENWDKMPYSKKRKEKPSNIVNGYIKTFDPDVLVICSDRALPKEVDTFGLRVIKSDELWKSFLSNGEGQPDYGIGIFEILNAIYEQDFKYKRRFSQKVVIPKISKEYSLFWSSVVGNYPKEFRNIILEEYKSALDIEIPTLKPKILSSLYKNNKLTPRAISRFELDNYSSAGLFTDTIFFMDATKGLDIIDFWNLRATGRKVVPFPIQYSKDKEIQKIVRDFINMSYGSLKHNPKIFNHASFIKSRSLEMKQMEQAVKSLKVRKKSSPKGGLYFSLQWWYPRMWQENYVDSDNVIPVEVYNSTQSIDVIDEDGTISLPPVLPKFLGENQSLFRRKVGYVNEINITPYSFGSKMISQVFPMGKENTLRVIDPLGMPEQWRVGKKSLIREVSYQHSQRWAVPDSQDIFFSWLKDLGFSDLKLSPPGILAKQIFFQLDGWLRIFAINGILELFDSMSRGSHSEVGMAVGAVKSKIELMGRDTQFLDFLNTKKIFKIGANIQCPKCFRHSWYSLSDLKEETICLKCLNSFPTISSINNKCWYYKTAGPFSIGNHAEGAYSVLLCYDFFVNVMHLKTSVAFSFNFEKNGEKLEADLGLLWLDSLFDNVSNNTLFAECKSYNNFEQGDIDRMALLVQNFPGAVIVFSTLKNELTVNEKKMIKKLAKKCRKYHKNNLPINPLLVLTSNELLSLHHPPYCWRGNSKLTEREKSSIHSLYDICNASQKIYLDLPSWYSEWDEEWKKKSAVRKKKLNAEYVCE